MPQVAVGVGDGALGCGRNYNVGGSGLLEVSEVKIAGGVGSRGRR